MTTHETRPEDRPVQLGAPEDQAVPLGTTTSHPDDVGTVGPTGDFGRAQEAGAAPPQQTAESTATAGSPDRTLFADGDLTDLRSRWTEVQSAFVDDPRDCVQKADGLVSDVVDRLTAGFAQARSGLEEQWSRGEEVSTEDLRLALQRYRDFFERLLAV